MGLCSTAFAQKVGFVNANTIFEQYSAAREAEEAYQSELEDLNGQVSQMEEHLGVAVPDLSYLHVGPHRNVGKLQAVRERMEKVKFKRGDIITRSLTLEFH